MRVEEHSWFVFILSVFKVSLTFSSQVILEDQSHPEGKSYDFAESLAEFEPFMSFAGIFALRKNSCQHVERARRLTRSLFKMTRSTNVVPRAFWVFFKMAGCSKEDSGN